MPAQDRLASIRAAWAQIRINMQYHLTYPHEIWTDLLQMLLQMLVERQVWIALYGGQETYAGVTLAQAVSYQLVNVIVVRLFFTWVLWSANHRIRSGDIVFQITRPMYYGHILLFEFIGQSVPRLLTSSVPMFILACLLFKLTLPASASVWLSFGLSLGLGFLTAFYVDYILSLIGFWTTELGGLFWAKGSIIQILGGSYLPLWIYPPVLRRILALLPFQGISYTPVAIFVGQIGLDQVSRAFTVQIVWLVIMAVGSRRLYASAVKKLAVQGG
jgi:ABC-2 type transport system permease protein